MAYQEVTQAAAFQTKKVDQPLSWSQEQEALRPEGIEFEPHFKVAQIAKIWGFSRETIRRLFKDEPGVIRLGRSESRFRRGYESLSIPESVVRLVHCKLRQKTRRSA